jgi:hypothetical protein
MAATAEDVEVEVLSQQLGSPSKPAGKKQMMGGGRSTDQALELSESQE